MNKEKRNAYVALALVSFFWGTTYVAARVGAKEMPGFFMAGVRQFISGLLMVLFFLAKGYKFPDWKQLRQLFIQGMLLLCIANGLLTWAMQYISGGLAAVIVALVPLFVALFSAWLSKTGRISRTAIAGLVIGFAGVLVIFSDYLGEMKKATFVLGLVLSLLSVISWSYGTVYSKRLHSTTTILFGVGLQMLFAGVVMLIVCGLTGQYTSLTTATPQAIAALAYLVVFGSLVAYSAYVFALKKLPATQVTIYAYINPVVAVLAGWLLLAEKMTFVMLAGMVITLAGVYLVNRASRKRANEKKTTLVSGKQLA